MKTDTLILVAAVAVAGVMVASKTGLIKSKNATLAASPSGLPRWAPLYPMISGAPYNPANPAQYLTIDQIATQHPDYDYVPSFDQTVDTVVSGGPDTRPGPRDPNVWW